jgi:hypothetical protein
MGGCCQSEQFTPNYMHTMWRRRAGIHLPAVDPRDNDLQYAQVIEFGSSNVVLRMLPVVYYTDLPPSDWARVRQLTMSHPRDMWQAYEQALVVEENAGMRVLRIKGVLCDAYLAGGGEHDAWSWQAAEITFVTSSSRTMRLVTNGGRVHVVSVFYEHLALQYTHCKRPAEGAESAEGTESAKGAERCAGAGAGVDDLK